MSWFNLVGIYALAGLCLIIGYLFYDKNFVISCGLLAVGVCLAIAIIISEIELKHEELKAREHGWIN